MSRPTNDDTNEAWRFIRRFFVVGVCAAAVWIGVGYALALLSLSTDHWGLVGKIVWVTVHVTFPIVYWLPYLLLDAEDAATIVVMLGIAAFSNGLCYALIGLFVWYINEGLRKFWALAIRKSS